MSENPILTTPARYARRRNKSRQDQRDGEHQLRLRHLGPGAGASRPGQLAGLRLPLHAIAAGAVRRGHRLGDAAGHLALGGIHGHALARDTARILAATAAMAGVVWLSSQAMQSWLGAGKLGYLADVAVSVPLGAVVFFLAGRWCAC